MAYVIKIIPPAKTIVSNVPFGLITNIIPNKINA